MSRMLQSFCRRRMASRLCPTDGVELKQHFTVIYENQILSTFGHELQADCISTLYPGLQQQSAVKWNGSITNMPPSPQPPPPPWTDRPKPHDLIHLFHSVLRSEKKKTNYKCTWAYKLHIQLLFWSCVSLRCSIRRYLCITPQFCNNTDVCTCHNVTPLWAYLYHTLNLSFCFVYGEVEVRFHAFLIYELRYGERSAVSSLEKELRYSMVKKIGGLQNPSGRCVG
jgi:hypothetical protein